MRAGTRTLLSLDGRWGGRRFTQSPAVELFPLWRGFLLPQLTFTFEVVDGRPVSLDARLRELLLGVKFGESSARSRAEQLALLARWYYRGTRVGEFVPFDSYQQLPFRKIVGAVSRVARHAPPPAGSSGTLPG